MSTTITQFNRDSAATIHAEAIELLQPLAEKYGIEINEFGGTIGGTELKLSFQFKVTNEDGLKAQFAKDCRFYGITPEAFGAIYDDPKYGPAKLIGFANGRSKFVVKAQTRSGVILYPTSALETHWRLERFHNAGPVQITRLP